MSFLLAALLAAAPLDGPANPPSLGRTAWIVATVEHSEWCPAGDVRLDLATGRYERTHRAPRRICGQAHDRRVTSATLGRKRLAAVRAASLRVLAEGLESRACRNGEPPENPIVSNGGTPILVLTTGSVTGSAPDDHSCWSAAALALHDVLDETFASDSR